MKNLLKLVPVVMFFIFVPALFGAEAAYLKFDKTTATAANGATFQVAVMVEPGTDALSSADVYVVYDPLLLKATVVTVGTQFPTVTNDFATLGKVYIAGMVNDTATPVTVIGTLATITFQALKDGSATLSFDCNTSKIIKNDINFSNVIVCSTNGTSAVTIGGGGTQPTSAPPSQLPQTGIFDNVIKFAIPGAILFLIGVIVKLALI